MHLTFFWRYEKKNSNKQYAFRSVKTQHMIHVIQLNYGLSLRGITNRKLDKKF